MTDYERPISISPYLCIGVIFAIAAIFTTAWDNEMSKWDDIIVANRQQKYCADHPAYVMCWSIAP